MPKTAPIITDTQVFDHIFQQDRQFLAQTALPIFTVAGTYKEDLKGLHHQRANDIERDIVFSRAHYSMAFAAALQAWGKKIDPHQAWLVDPTNYVTGRDLLSVKLTDFVGRTVARWSILKFVKDTIDRFGRQQLPILDSITAPTLYLAQDIHRPILSFHIATGNILAEAGKEVYQVITDPHVREDYLSNAACENLHFFVFDEDTKLEFFHRAKQLGIKIPQAQLKKKVIVSGPPIDRRILACNKTKTVWQNDRPLRICLTTGGIGTNREEIANILQQLLPEIKKQIIGQNSKIPTIELIFYAGTNQDFRDMAVQLAKHHHLRFTTLSPHDPAAFTLQQRLTVAPKTLPHNRFTILYHPQIVDANELLIRSAFPWADLFISKPSGDMAYDAATSGAALLTLKEWGEWEFNVRHVFESRYISKKCDSSNIINQIEQICYSENYRLKIQKMASTPIPTPLLETTNKNQSWLTQAMSNAKKLEPIFFHGIETMEKELLS